ncbi:MAG: succinylglutamate desuccinylase/aspartoacylase family protein [Halobacteriaceae archaeon]
MQLGTVASRPGEVVTGRFPVTDLPTGATEALPVIVAEGEAPGPTLWVTGTIHGEEVTGLAVAQDLLTPAVAEALAGTVVCVPTLNPAGLRRTERISYYDGDDPNRYFPDPTDDESGPRPPRVQERIDERIYEAITDSADALLDLHTAQVGSVPFVIRDRVLYGEVRDEGEAQALAEDLATLAEAFGVPVVNEYEAEKYTDEGLHRSTAGAVLNGGGIPAVTVELGTHSVVDEPMYRLGVAGCYRVMVELAMLEADHGFGPEPDPVAPPVEYPVKRAVHPHSEVAGIARHRVGAGDVLEAGDPVADIVAPTGEHRATVTTDYDGYVLGRYGGVATYENDPLCSLAVRDESPLVVPRNED